MSESKLSLKPTARLVIEIDGIEYPVSRPKMGAIRKLEDEIKAASDAGKSVVAVVHSHLVACGLPAEVIDALDADQLDEVSAFLNRPKKK
jgi:hypothetical protein